MKQVARTLARRKNTSKTSLITNQVLVRGDAAAKKDSASQQGPLIVFETREKRRPAILQGRGSLCFSKVVSSAAESRLILGHVCLSFRLYEIDYLSFFIQRGS